MVRFNFRVIKALSIFESSNVKSCASSAGLVCTENLIRVEMWTLPLLKAAK
jgi:hypothetical protein